MKVSEGMLERALQVMAQVVAVLERQGHSVGVSDTGETIALIKGDRYVLRHRRANPEGSGTEAPRAKPNGSLGL